MPKMKQPKSSAMDRATDKRVESIEEQIGLIYKRHEKVVKALYEEYFSNFKIAEQEKRTELELGNITEKQFKDWQIKTIATGTKWKLFKRKVANELLKAKREAMLFTNSQLAMIYADNYNFTAKVLEDVQNDKV